MQALNKRTLERLRILSRRPALYGIDDTVNRILKKRGLVSETDGVIHKSAEVGRARREVAITEAGRQFLRELDQAARVEPS